jgi:hypothetical protein
MHHRRGFVIALIAALIAVGAAGAHAVESRTPANQVPGNLEVISKLTAEIAAEFEKAFPPGVAKRGLYIQTKADDEQYQVIRDVFTSTLTDHGFTVYASAAMRAAGTPDSTVVGSSRQPYRLEIRALEFAIWYPRIFRSFVIGGKRVERTANVAISATLMNLDDNSVVWVKEVSRESHDEFSYQKLTQVENDLFTFTKPERKATNWSKVVEPVVVSGIIVGLIYLFFSNQSNN